MKYLILFVFIFIINFTLSAQHEDKNWYFGTGTDGIIFDINNNPIKVSNKYSSGNFGFEGIIVVSNPSSGDLLFYSDGNKVINKNHAVMTNGTGLSGNFSGAQCVQCCPMPGSCAKKYYLFTNSAMDQTNGSISYSIVDFTTNPLGIVTNINTALWAGPSAEGMCLVNKSNSNDYWLIVSQGSTASYRVFPLTSTGIGTSVLFTFTITGSSYQMNYSKTAQKIVVTGYGNKKITTVNFDANTGILSNEVQLGSSFTSSTGAARFSPDGTKLYATDIANLWQYNFTTSVWTNMNTNVGIPHDLRVGPDGKMYHINSHNSSQPMAVIDFPNNNAIGNSCNYHILTFTPAFNGEVRRFPEFVTLPAPPTAIIDNYTISNLLPANFNVLVNDTDVQGDPIILDSIITNPLHGVAVINNGQITYTPYSSTGCGIKDTLIYRIKDVNCSYDTALVIINNINTSLLVSLGNDTSVCQGNTLTLNAGNPGYSYLWNTLQTSQSINVTSSGTYSVIVSNGSGCIGYDTINVLINPTPLDINDSIFVSHHGILAHYPFDNHTFDISGHNYHGILNGPVATTDRLNNSNKAYSFNGNNQFVNVPHDIWSDELSLSAWIYSTDLGTTDPTQTGKMIFFKAPNTGVNQDYTLAIAYINSGFRAQFVFGQGASQFFYINSNTIIQTNQWYLITATRKNGIAKLYVNGNLDNSATYPFVPVNLHFNLKLGMSHASFQSFAGKLDDLRIYKRALCAREVKSLYHNQYLLKVKLQDTILCNNGSTFLDIINPEPGISYQLQSYPSGNPIGNPQITYCDSILSLPTGNITSTSYFTILATDTVTGCSNQLDSIFKVSISPYLLVNLGNDTLICQGNTIVLNAGNPGCSYQWNSGQSTQTINISNLGVYSVIVTNASGCVGYDTINVSITTFLPVNLGNDTTICIGESVVLDAGISGAIYLWNTNATSQSISVTNAGSYWVAVNSNGCIGSDTIIVNIVPKPTISLGNDTIMCPGDLIILTPGSGFNQYLWSDGATTNSINVNIPGNYSVTVSNGACFVSDEIIIEECGSEIWIPNVFTPNGDGINETFYPVCFNIDKISMLIFNRWGNQLFEGSGKACVWDGKYHGELCPDGVYYYLIEYEQKGKLKGMQKRHGSVTLLR
jgi:gliding motility-associated-like protein